MKIHHHSDCSPARGRDGTPRQHVLDQKPQPTPPQKTANHLTLQTRAHGNDMRDLLEGYVDWLDTRDLKSTYDLASGFFLASRHGHWGGERGTTVPFRGLHLVEICHASASHLRTCPAGASR